MPLPAGPLGRLAVPILGVALTLTGCSSGGGSDPKPPPDRGTPLADVDTLTLSVVRGPFCERLSGAAVERALQAEVASSTAYDSGDKAPVTGDVKDVAHEFSCSFRAHDGTTARAWVFAPPVPRDRARAIVAAAESAEGCSPVPAAPTFGSPTVATQCAAKGRTTLTFRGLFGDAWLSCSVAVTASAAVGSATDAAQPDLADRAGRWCAEVVGAAGPS